MAEVMKTFCNLDVEEVDHQIKQFFSPFPCIKFIFGNPFYSSLQIK